MTWKKVLVTRKIPEEGLAKLREYFDVEVNELDRELSHEELKERKIWGAGLDVYEKEPKVEDGLKDLNNVVLCPHLGSATDETRIKMSIMAADNIIFALNGKVPPNCITLK